MPAHHRPSWYVAGQLLGVVARGLGSSGVAFLKTVLPISIAAGISILLPTPAAAQSITITSINGEAVPPADEVFIDESLFPVFEVEWQATANATAVSVFLDGASVPCDGICSGSSGFFQVDHPAGGCRHTIQIRGTFVPGGQRNSQVLGFWSTPYENCTGSEECNQSAVGGPIDVANGKMYHEMTDLEIRGPLPIEFVRRYDSQSTLNGPLGFGWRHGYLAKLEFPTAGQTVFVDEQGRRVFFAKRADGTWDENRIEHLVLTQPGTPAWRVTDKQQTKYEFDSLGTLTRIADRNNNQLTFGYTGGNLTSIRDSFGRTVALAYVGGRIDSLSAGSRTISYDYTGDNLTRVDLPDGSFFTYEYTDLGDPHNLTTVRDALGHIIEDHEYVSDRVTHFEQDGGVNALTITYDSPTQTTVTNSLGAATVYTHGTFHGLVTESTGPGCTSCGDGTNAILMYDGFLNLEEHRDGRGIRTRMTYDSKGNPLTRTEAFGTAVARTWTFTYHPTFNFLATARIATVGTCGSPEKVVTNTFDGATGDLLQQQIAGCNGLTPFTYTTGYTYDSHGQIKTIDGPRTDVTDLTTNDYYADADADSNRRGRLQRTTNALGHETTFNGYDLFGNIGSLRDANLVETVFLYDARDRLLEKRVKGSVPSDDIVTINQYDVAGRLDLVKLPTCSDAGMGCLFSFDYVYDNADRLTEVRDATGNSIVYSYDSASNRTREEFRDPLNVLLRFTNLGYNSRNLLRYVYFNDIPPETPGSIFWKFEYDGNGNRMTEQDPELHLTTYDYDEFNRLKSITQTAGLATIFTQYGYDLQDNLKTIVDPRGLMTVYESGDMGWRLQATSPDTGITTFTYDPAGNLMNSTDAKGTLVMRSYDAIERLLTVTYPDSSLNVAHSYDSVAVSFGIGRRTGMADASGSAVYHYDRRGLLMKEEKTIGGLTFTTQYGYDKNGNTTQVFYPTEDPLRRQGRADIAFNLADRITGMSAMINGITTSVATGIAYKPFGPLSNLSFGNGRSDSRSYDTRYRPDTWTLSGILNYTHQYDDDDNLMSRADNLNPSNNRSFGYDGAHRLTAASGPWGSGIACPGLTTYSYDETGNRTCKGEGLATLYSYTPGTNRLASTSGGEPATYSHDMNGSMDSDGLHAYGYDDAGRVADVHLGATAAYTYDGDGRRVVKSSGGVATYYFYHQDGKLLTELVASEETGKDYLYLGDVPLARVDWSPQEFLLGDVLVVTSVSPNVHLDWTAVPAGSNRYVVRRKTIVDFNDKSFNGNIVIATSQDPTRIHDDPVLADANTYFYLIQRRVSNDTLYFYHADHLGTPLAMTDAGGSVVWKAEHLPFGGIHSIPVSSVTNNLRLPGQYADQESGLNYNWHRQYSAVRGRYLQADPIGLAGGVNLYAYGNGNPLSFTDPTGLFCTRDFVDHYYRGAGRPIDLGAVGLLAGFKSASSVHGEVTGFKIVARTESRRLAEKLCSGPACGQPSASFAIDDRGNTDVTTEPCLFSVGRSSFFVHADCGVSANCAGKRFTYSCGFSFQIRDWFRDPVGLGIEVGGTPYRINAYWAERLSGSGPF